MGLSQVLQLLQNRAHPSQRGGVPIVKTFRREATGVEDVPAELLGNIPMDVQPMPMTDAQQPRTPFVPRVAPTLDASGSNALLQQAQAILAGLGNDAPPQIKAPNNESIALALLPALLGAGTNYIGSLGQGYMAGQNQELARIEQERRRREQNIVRQAQGLQSQAGNLITRENALFNQENQNFRNEADNARALTTTEIVQKALNERFGMGDQTKRDLAGNRLEFDREKEDFDQETANIENAVKAWTVALKEVQRDNTVDEDDIKWLTEERKRIGQKYADRLAMPRVGDSWAKIKSDSDSVYRDLTRRERERHNKVMEGQGQARIDKSTATRGGGAGAPGVIGGGRSASSLKGSIQTLQGKIDGEKKAQARMGDPKMAAMAELRILRLAGERDTLQKELDKLGKLSRPLGEIPEVAVTDRSKFDKVNPMLLQDALSFGGFKPTISTANSGHSEMTKAGFPSRHKQNNAVDISAINGIPVGTPAGRKLADEYVRNLEARGYVRNRESGNDKAVLWQTDGHYNHIHISRNSQGDGGGGIPRATSVVGDGTQKRQSEIDAEKKPVPLPKNPPAGDGKPTVNQIKVGGQNLGYNLTPNKKK